TPPAAPHHSVPPAHPTLVLSHSAPDLRISASVARTLSSDLALCVLGTTLARWLSVSGSTTTCSAAIGHRPWNQQPFLHNGSSLCWLHRGSPSWLWPGSRHLAPPAPSPSCLFPGSSLHLIQFIVLLLNLLQFCLPAFLLALCHPQVTIPHPLLCPPPKSSSVPPFVVPVAQSHTRQERGELTYPRPVCCV
ncbi:hypothetical protein M9458_026215, partial [Cirrhinus mrigala]